jgi:hypothetical protein
MTRTDERAYNSTVDPENEPRGSLALVIKTDISRMPEIVRLVEQVPGARIVYQRTSVGRLRIIEEGSR